MLGEMPFAAFVRSRLSLISLFRLAPYALHSPRSARLNRRALPSLALPVRRSGFRFDSYVFECDYFMLAVFMYSRYID